MTKRVFRYFFDYIDGQEKWLNEMAVKGWRLIKCGQLSYDFESCEPGEYEYAVEFVAHRSYSRSKNYKEFIESLGYETLYKNVNVGVYIGKAQWRPWGDGAGQITTAPGSLQKELLIVEKKKDSKPFELHTDLSDLLVTHTKIRTVYFWYIGEMFALAAMFLAFAILFSPYLAIGAMFFAAFGMLWLTPAMNASAKVRRLKDEAETNEYEAEPAKRKVVKVFTMITIYVLLGTGVSWAAYAGGFTINSGSAVFLRSSSGQNYWNASYSRLNGFRQRNVSLKDGQHTFNVEIITDSGQISLSIIGKDGTKYYKSSELPTSVFEVQVDSKDKVTLRVDAKNHYGSYKIKWE